MSSLPANIKRIGSKATKKRWRHHFSHYKSGNDFYISITLTVRSCLTRQCIFLYMYFYYRIKYCLNQVKGAFCCHGHQSFDPICLKTLCSLSQPQVMLHTKFDQDWPTGLRDIQVRKCKIFIIQGQVTPKWVVWSGLKSNSSEPLCLSWLPPTLMKIR